jgi:hypothetical protein
MFSIADLTIRPGLQKHVRLFFVSFGNYLPSYTCRNRKNEDWNEWDQMDAHELLRFLLDGISMEEMDVRACLIKSETLGHG